MLGKKGDREAELQLYAKGKRPDAIIDYPVHATDYELVDIFNWQEEVSGMYIHMELIRHLSVNTTHTIDNYIKKGYITPDFVVPMSENRVFRYYKKERVKEFSERFGWTIIEDENKAKLFMDMIKEMRMDHSYKPVLLKGILLHCDTQGKVKISALVEYFKEYYQNRKKRSQIIEKDDSIFSREHCTDKEIEREILSYPFRRFENMSMMHHTKTLGVIQVDSIIWKKLTDSDKQLIAEICDKKLEQYYERISK